MSNAERRNSFSQLEIYCKVDVYSAAYRLYFSCLVGREVGVVVRGCGMGGARSETVREREDREAGTGSGGYSHGAERIVNRVEQITL